jgi:hypothetical protein
MSGYVDTLLRSDNPSAQGQQNPSDTRGEMVRLFTTSFHNGSDLNAADRAYVAKVVSARTGLSQADAEKRVKDVVTQVKTDLDEARKAAAISSVSRWAQVFLTQSLERPLGYTPSRTLDCSSKQRQASGHYGDTQR